MLRQSSRPIPLQSTRLITSSRSRAKLHTSLHRNAANNHSKRNPAAFGRAAFLAAGAAGALWYYSSSSRIVLNDAESKTSKKRQDTTALATQVLFDDEHLTTIAWGSNKDSLISPTTPQIESLRSPAAVLWLRGVALRDLALHEKHGVCVDARGDVYQWDARTTLPTSSLAGKNIIGVQATPTRVFALSASGKVFSLPSEPPTSNDNTQSSSSWFSFLSSSSDQSQNHIELGTEQKLGKGEKFVSISAGSDHLLALTSHGRTFAHPISQNANTHGQLGFRKFTVPSLDGGSGSSNRIPVELIPKTVLDPYANRTRNQRVILDGLPEPPLTPESSVTSTESKQPESSKDYVQSCDRLFEIPSLRGIKVAQAVAGSRTSFARTENGSVLAWGANEHGQLGLGSTMTVDTITIPTEVVFSKSAQARTRSQCVDINTGGDLTFFTVERTDGTFIPSTDLLACGMGQWGGLGTGVYTTAQGDPARVKSVSGLVEYSEETQNLQSIAPHALSVSPSGHVLLTLDTRSRAGPGATAGGARDVLAWGAGRSYQLGRGKRASSAVPAPLELPTADKNEATGSNKERFMLARRRAREVLDLGGHRWGKNVEVEQVAVAGWESSLVYWRVCRN